MPVIVKKNTGSKGSEVYLCHTNTQLSHALQSIFSRQNAEYDHIALAQRYIDAKYEYRVTIFNNKVEFAYIKDVANAKFEGNLSPLHWENASATLVTEVSLLKKFQIMLDEILKVVPFIYGGIDIIESDDGSLYLIELNSSPGYEEYLKYCPREPLIRLYEKIIIYLVDRYA